MYYVLCMRIYIYIYTHKTSDNNYYYHHIVVLVIISCQASAALDPVEQPCFQELFTLLDLCVSSLRRGHANLLCIVPILTDDPRRES